MDLRDETRSLQQAKPQLEENEFAEDSEELGNTQAEIFERLQTVIEKIEDLPDGAQKFGKEIAQLNNAATAMEDATDILFEGDTGPPAIAAETDAIEWLLKAKRSKGNGSGGGGGSPGGGSRTGADTNIAALALIGESKDKTSTIQKRENAQATGKAGRELPEEFRRGLDAYFENLESNR